MEDNIKEDRKTSFLTYQSAGVNIDRGNKLVQLIQPLTRSTSRPGADGKIGGFGGIFDLKSSGFKDPLLIAATDGVGTKVRIAIESNRHETIGIDLVAMCVNDLIVQGAEPLFFLDYYATGKLSISNANKVITGIANGCRTAGCALIGGETAEMPGMYANDDYDLAGFAVGAVERENLLLPANTNEGDILLGLRSDGLHSNGFSLVRRVLEKLELGFHEKCPYSADQTIAESLITPTRIYVNPCLKALKTGGVIGLAHITGGGLIENPPRAYKDTLTARIDAGQWSLPPVYKWLIDTKLISSNELARTFNCGIGMVVIVTPKSAELICKLFKESGEIVNRIGILERRSPGMPEVVLDNLGSWTN